jgi:LacI family transcriptional regulator
MSKISLKTLAGQLGVSISTVSKALQDSYEISPETKERVLDLAKKLNFQPNPYASSLRRRQTQNIAVVVPEVANNFFALAIDGIESVAQERHYHVLIYQTHDNAQKEASICQHLHSGRTDGVIMSVTAHTQDYGHLAKLGEQGVPVVFFDRVCHEIETAKVTTDDFVGGLGATEHLIQNGARRIAYLSLSPLLSIDNKRRAGYLEALHKHDLAPYPAHLVHCGVDDASAYQKIKELLSGPDRPDGIFASVEKLALLVYQVCRELALQIPQDIKVICFANLKTAGLLSPPLSTVAQPAFEMGREAANILFRHLYAKKTAIVNENIVLKSTLVSRESTQGNVIPRAEKSSNIGQLK